MAKKAAKGKKTGGGSKKKKTKAAVAEEMDGAVKRDPQAEERLWAARFTISENARKEHRDNASLLVRVNAELEKEMQTAEADAIEVVAHLRKELAQATDELKAAKEQVKETRRQTRAECEAMEEECAVKIRQITLQLNDKASENEKLKKELHLLNEFRQRREELEEEVQELQELNRDLQREHERTVQRMETKFFEEKSRMQKNMERQLVELTEEAHRAAVAKLDETTRATYQENVRLTDDIRLHTTEASQLRQANAQLSADNNELRQELSEKSTVIQTSVEQATLAAEKTLSLKDKVQTLEASLSQMLKSHKEELEERNYVHVTELERAARERLELQEALDIKAAELKRVRFLSRNMLDQRSEVEQFLLESIATVKREIAATRNQYKNAARVQYNESVRAANAGGQPQPSVRDLSVKGFEAEFRRAEEAEADFRKIDVADMTWEQRERVLQMLLAKINGADAAKRRAHRASDGGHAATANLRQTTSNLSRARVTYLPALTAPPKAMSRTASPGKPATRPDRTQSPRTTVFLTEGTS